MENNLPKRKHPRLNEYDYSSPGAYFVTICTHNRSCVLSQIVGRGFTPAETNKGTAVSRENKTVPYEIKYNKFGKIAKHQLLLLEERYPSLIVDQYVIMPNHIHAVLILKNETAGASPRPTIMDIVCTYKSLTAKECRKMGFAEKLFQTSFYDHIIRDRNDYTEIVKYIRENPMNWYYDELFPHNHDTLNT